VQDNCHTYENGLCFWRLPNGRLCPNKAIKAVHDKDGNGRGIFCKKHYEVKVRMVWLEYAE
jgi:hypothetical protein